MAASKQVTWVKLCTFQQKILISPSATPSFHQAKVSQMIHLAPEVLCLTQNQAWRLYRYGRSCRAEMNAACRCKLSVTHVSYDSNEDASAFHCQHKCIWFPSRLEKDGAVEL